MCAGSTAGRLAVAALLAGLHGSTALSLGRGWAAGAGEGLDNDLDNATLENQTLELLNSFQVCSAKCREPEHFQRMGEIRDGGYQVCMQLDKKPAAAFSLGVGNHDKWAYHVSQAFQTPVYQFDCNRVDRKVICKDCTLYRYCIVSENDLKRFRNVYTFNEMLKHTNQSQAAPGSLLMKMDIEGSEWSMLAELKGKSLRKFGQIIVEFHELADVKRHPVYLAAMRRLRDAGFKLAHIHGNNQDGMYTVGQYRIPMVVEATFVLEPGPATACLSHVKDFPGENTNQIFNRALPPSELPTSV